MSKILENIKKYRFELRHLTVLFLILIFFQLILSFIQKNSLKNFLDQTQEWYQQDSAEKMANLTTTSLELLLENINVKKINSDEERENIIQSFNIILNQQLLQQNVEDICLLLVRGNELLVVDEGKMLYYYLAERNNFIEDARESHLQAVNYFEDIKYKVKTDEMIYSFLEGTNTFHIIVPFVPNGEYHGALYMRKRPDFSYMQREIISSYDEAAIIYSSLILFGLLAMYYISSYTVKERNEAQKLLYDENEKYLKEQIRREKETLFTKRIYHTHHKAEKVMGFIKEDLREINEENIEEVRYRVNKYSNFVSRVIYDMKWYDPPINTIRNQMFNTNLNEVIRFLEKFIFLRISSQTDIFSFKLNLSEKLPNVHINEFVIWEILEPIIQNSIEHSGVEKIKIEITTIFDESSGESRIIIEDNGKGISDGLLLKNDDNEKIIFSEEVSTKQNNNQNSGYGCYIAYQMAKRCGWRIDAFNNDEGGSSFVIIIPNRTNVNG